MTIPSPPLVAHDVSINVSDGTVLKAWYWSHPNPRGLLVIAHGLGEHGGCYRHLVEAIGPLLEIDVLAFDFRGHGRSPGRRGLVLRFEELMADLRAALEWGPSDRARALPRFLFAHSYGGLVALRMIADDADGLQGLALSNPALALKRAAPWPKRAAGAILRRFAPWITLATDVGPEEMTRDPEMLAEREADRLRHTRICAAIFFALVESLPALKEQAPAIQVPTLLLLGGADPLIDPAASIAWFERLASPDKTLRVYPDMLHEPINDLGRGRVMADLASWLGQRLPPRVA